MMSTTVTFKWDLINGYSATEEVGGRVESVTIPCIAEVAGTDANPIGVVLDYMDDPNNSTTGRPYLWGNPEFSPATADRNQVQHLRLVSRTNIRSLGMQSNGKVRVSMDLQYIRRCNEIKSRNDSYEWFTQTGDVSLSSIKTQKMQRGARPDDAATDIQLTYNGVTKYGEIDVLEPRSNFSLRQDALTKTPESIIASMAGYVNDTQWRGFDAKSVLCTRVSYRLLTVAPNYSNVGGAVYRFDCEFEKSAGPTWDVEIVYRDQQGKVPSDVAWGTSRKLIAYYPSVNFDSLFTDV